MEDMERRLAEERARYEEVERRKQSQVVKMGLPRPVTINPKYLKNAVAEIGQVAKDRGEAEKMIFEEIQMMMTQDNFRYPFKGMKEVKKSAQGYLDINPVYMD
jgi:hypothetical protein